MILNRDKNISTHFLSKVIDLIVILFVKCVSDRGNYQIEVFKALK